MKPHRQYQGEANRANRGAKGQAQHEPGQISTQDPTAHPAVVKPRAAQRDQHVGRLAEDAIGVGDGPGIKGDQGDDSQPRAPLDTGCEQRVEDGEIGDVERGRTELERGQLIGEEPGDGADQ